MVQDNDEDMELFAAAEDREKDLLTRFLYHYHYLLFSECVTSFDILKYSFRVLFFVLINFIIANIYILLTS